MGHQNKENSDGIAAAVFHDFATAFARAESSPLEVAWRTLKDREDGISCFIDNKVTAKAGSTELPPIEELSRHKNKQGYSSDAFFPAVKTKALQLAKAAGKTQVPAWMNDTGRESFVFVPCPSDQPCTVVIDNSTTINTFSNNGAADKQFWDEIKNSTDANDYTAYLKQFPKGNFVALAESRRDKYSQSSKQSSVLDSLRLPDSSKKEMSVEDMQKERENNPNGTSIYDSCRAG